MSVIVRTLMIFFNIYFVSIEIFQGLGRFKATTVPLNPLSNLEYA